MAIVVTSRGAKDNGLTQSASITLDPFTPAANSILFFIGLAENDNAGNISPECADPAGGPTWTTLDEIDQANAIKDSGYEKVAGLWRTDIGGSPSELTLSWDGNSGAGDAMWYSASAFDVTGANSTIVQHPTGQSANPGGANNTAETFTFPTTPATGNTIIVGFLASVTGTEAMATPTAGGRAMSRVNGTDPNEYEQHSVWALEINGTETLGGSGELVVTMSDVGGTAAFGTFSFGIELEPSGGATTPSAISNLAGTAGDEQVALTWTAPADGGSAITDYEVNYRLSGETASAFGTSTSENGTSLGSNNAQPLPASAASGDLIIAIIGHDNPSTTAITVSTGWTPLNAITQGTNVVKGLVAARVLDGTTGDNILSVSGATQDYVVQLIRVPSGQHGCTNADLATTLKIATAQGASGNIDPANLDAGSAADRVWFVAGILDCTTGSTISAVPANYTSILDIVSASSTSSVRVHTARRDLTNTQTENPGTFTNTSRNWIAYTIAVPPYVPPWQTFSDGTSASTGATVTGLTNSTAYDFRVRAVNAIGAGPWSNIAGPYTPENATTVPSAISNLAGTPGVEEVALTWTAPADGGSAITDYVVEYRTTIPSGIKYPVARSGRKWIDQHGNPYVLKCIASWGMPQKLSNANITTRLEEAAARGFNAALIMLFGYDLDANWDPWVNQAGQAVWTGTPYQSSLGAAWGTVDWIVEECTRLEMTVVMVNYAAFGTTGPRAAMEAAYTANPQNLIDYGEALATRYASYPNIVWHVGADDSWGWGTTIANAYEAIHQGIRNIENGTYRLVVGEPANGSSAYSQWPQVFDTTGHVRFDANGIYSWNDQAVVQIDAVLNESGATSFPVWDCEPPYAGNVSATGAANRQELRERVYSTFIRGCVGLNYGDESWWPFGAGAASVMASDELLDYQRAVSLLDQYVLDSTWEVGHSDTGFLNSGIGSGDTKAAVGVSQVAAMVYFPSSRTGIEVDTTILAGTGNVRLRWYDPTKTTDPWTEIAASEAQSATRSITYPASANNAGDNDWVLVVDYADGSSPLQPGAWQSFADGTSASTGATVTGLTGGESYDFRVAAVNAIGQGAWSNIAGPYIPTAAPVLNGLYWWNGSAFVEKPLMRHNGTSWVQVDVSAL